MQKKEKSKESNSAFEKDVAVVNKECEQENLASVALNLLTKSSIYAVAQLVTSTGCIRKFMWFFVLLAGLLGCSYEVYRFLILYFQYPVVITLEVENNWKLDFPAVTVCNLNRISAEFYMCLLHNNTAEHCVKKKCGQLKPAQAPTRPVLLTEREKFVLCSNNFDGVYTKERLDSLIFLNQYFSLTTEERSKLGHQADSFITSCNFNGEACSFRNLTEYNSIQFGNCFTFNGQIEGNGEVLQIPYIGPNSGLELTLNLKPGEYSPISSSIGARVVIHESDLQPNPEDYGFNISPGFETSVAISQTSIHRLPDPYRDKCKRYEEKDANSPRHQEDCIRKCMQNLNMEKCGCFDLFLPTKESDKLCDMRNRTTVCCLANVTKYLGTTGTPCPCPLPCKSTNYEMTISSAEWPSLGYYKSFMKNYKTLTSNKMCENVAFEKTANDTSSEIELSDEEEVINMRTEVAKLKVFYKTLEKSYYKQEPMFQESELFSQLGGQLGLWLGISLVALFECVENISHLLHYCIKKFGWKRKKEMTSYCLEPVKISSI